MKFFKIFVLLFLLIIYKNFCYGLSSVKLHNLTGNDIEYLHYTYEHTSYKYLNFVLKNNKKVSLNSLGEINIDRMYEIKVLDTHDLCETRKYLGFDVRFGWVLELFIDGMSYGSICVTKSFLLDPFINAKIEYINIGNEKYIKFFNTGSNIEDKSIQTHIEYKLH